MLSHKKYQNISIDPAQFPEIKRAKLRYQVLEGRDVTWGDFFQFLISKVFSESDGEVLYAEMRQDEDHRPLTEQELAELGVVPDDVSACQLAPMVGASVTLSEASCELIAQKLAEKLRAEGS